MAVSNKEATDTPKTTEPVRLSRWSERAKKDIQHEKELLLQSRHVSNIPRCSLIELAQLTSLIPLNSRKSGLVDDDKEDLLNAMAMMATWKPPQLLTGLENPPVVIKSNEMKIQPNRMSTTPAVRYASENEVPNSPTLLSEFEKASDLSSRNSSAPQNIPFFTPSPSSASPSAGPAFNGNVSNNFAQQAFPPPAQPNMNPPSEATLETVLMMGLPLFLVGSNLQALQTLASNPGLLASFKDMNGVYKQNELINLVQTLTQNLVPQASQPNLMPGYAVPNPMYNTVVNQVHTSAATPVHTAATTPMHTVASNPAHTVAATPVHNSFVQSQPTHQQGSRGYRGDQNDGEANLHLSGYGPTTSNADIIGTRLLVQTCFLLSYLACINLHNLPCKSVVFTIRSCR